MPAPPVVIAQLRLCSPTPGFRSQPTRGGHVWRRRDRGRTQIWRPPAGSSVL